MLKRKRPREVVISSFSMYTFLSWAMKVLVLQDNLSHGLSIVSRAVSPRSTLPVLGNVLAATDDGRLRLSATNLELGITTWIGAKIEINRVEWKNHQ